MTTPYSRRTRTQDTRYRAARSRARHGAQPQAARHTRRAARCAHTQVTGCGSVHCDERRLHRSLGPSLSSLPGSETRSLESQTCAARVCARVACVSPLTNTHTRVTGAGGSQLNIGRVGGEGAHLVAEVWHDARVAASTQLSVLLSTLLRPLQLLCTKAPHHH